MGQGDAGYPRRVVPPLPRLSVVMFTNEPVQMVAASLARVRSIAHEIVVAVDERVPAHDLGGLQAVADRVVRAEFVPPLEANLAWLHTLATGDWVLRLDGDDLVSDALVRKLATPGWDEGITHAYVQYRWLWGEDCQILDQAPWWPDPALRLIRNLPGIAVFPTGAHETAQVAGAARFWDEALYHLDLVCHDRAAREAKAHAYERANPSLRTDRGWSVSTTYYLPELLRSPLRTAPLPPVDRAVVDHVLQARRSKAPVPGPATPIESVVRALDRRAPSPTQGDTRVRVLAHQPLVMVAERSAVLTVGVTNLTGRPWRLADDPPAVVGGRFFDANGRQVGAELREPLPGPLASGQETLVRLPIPPGVPVDGVRLSVAMVQDGVAWHDAAASISLRHVRGRRILISTGISPTPHLGDDLITQQVLAAFARYAPDAVPQLLAYPTDGIAERFGCEVVTSPVSVAATTSRRTEPGRRSRDLVAQARLMAKGDHPDDPAVAHALEPFAHASALILAPGGGLASRYAEEALMVYAVEALIARAFGLPVFIEGPSIGPIELRRDHAALAQLLNDAERVTVRDRGSADAARRIGRAVEPLVIPDPATAAFPPLAVDIARCASWLAERNVPGDRAYAVISVRGGTPDQQHLATVRAAVEALPEHTALIFLAHCTGDPAADDHQVLDDPWAGATLVPWDDTLGPGAAVALVAGASITIGSRFHLSVLAAAAGVPAVGLARDEYDRLRLRGLRAAGTAQLVSIDDPGAAAAAVRSAFAAPPEGPAPAWDAEAFVDAVAAELPPPPPLN